MITDIPVVVGCDMPDVKVPVRRWFQFWKPAALIIRHPANEVGTAEAAAPMSWEEAQGGYGW